MTKSSLLLRVLCPFYQSIEFILILTCTTQTTKEVTHRTWKSPNISSPFTTLLITMFALVPQSNIVILYGRGEFPEVTSLVARPKTLKRTRRPSIIPS